MSRLDTRILQPVCQRKSKLRSMTSMFRILLINLFSDPSKLVSELLKTRNLRWTNDVKTTQIVVEPFSAWEPELTANRPGLIIKRQDWQRVRLGLNDAAAVNMNGDEHYANNWMGSHTVFVLSGKDGECEEIAVEAFEYLNEFAPVVRVQYGLKAFAVASLGKIARLKEANNHFAAPIDVGYVLEETWVLRKDAAPLRRLDMTAMEF